MPESTHHFAKPHFFGPLHRPCCGEVHKIKAGNEQDKKSNSRENKDVIYVSIHVITFYASGEVDFTKWLKPVSQNVGIKFPFLCFGEFFIHPNSELIYILMIGDIEISSIIPGIEIGQESVRVRSIKLLSNFGVRLKWHHVFEFHMR